MVNSAACARYLARYAVIAAFTVFLSACGALPPMSPPSPSEPTPEAGPNARQTQPGPRPEEAPSEQAPRSPPKQFHLGPAALSLVSQAHKQSQSGDLAGAATTLERALRIEPNNPLLWIELGGVQLSENNGDQADSMGRKALALATGDPQAQSASWRLIADSLRLRHRNAEAAEADQKAAGLAASFLGAQGR
ncbi:MAG TPA: tetratricopeptide repeat protein [Steroidobacteraceae bacterium]|nr:tetratricopeptide repeat protein [Steroidobacteraceae bacterium]